MIGIKCAKPVAAIRAYLLAKRVFCNQKYGQFVQSSDCVTQPMSFDLRIGWPTLTIHSNFHRFLLKYGLLALALMIPAAGDAVSFGRLATFSGTNGAQPLAGVIQATNGNFYGTTVSGGTSGNGTVFVAGRSGGLTNLFSFSGLDGSGPSGLLVQGSDGNLYGTTTTGGTSGNGTAFVITPGGQFTNLVSFSGTNGGKPFGALVQGPDGNFYGTTSEGGAFGFGTVFMLTPDGTLSNLVSFGATNGSRPLSGLISKGTNLTFYGTTTAGGDFNAGTVYSLQISTPNAGTNALNTNTPAIVLTNLYSFTGGADGAGPQAALAADRSGNLFGTTAGGGTNHVPSGWGSVFEITSNGSFTNIASFAATNGATPFAPLALAPDGNFYGTTTAGGSHGKGCIFSVSTNGTITARYSFAGGADGANPYYSGLVQGTNGSLYGTASTGGTSGDGTFFQISGFPPTIVTSPENIVAAAGATVSFSVGVAGSTPFTFRWLKNSNTLSDGGRFSGTTNSTLTIAAVTTNDSGLYQVVVRNSAGVVTNSGSVLSVISPYGTNIPVARITSPALGSVILKQIFTVRGVTASSVAIAHVYVRLNGGNWQLAKPSGGWANWTAKFTFVPGTNALEAYAINIVGNVSATNLCQFTVGKDGFTPMTVQTTGNGKVSPNNNLVWLREGGTYHMTAIPDSGNFFVNWSQAISTNPPNITTKPQVTFVAQTNLVLTANFIPNPFFAVKGTFTGLFSQTNGKDPTSAGLFTFTLTTRGTFSGNLQTPAARFSMSGKFDTNGTSQTLARYKSETLGISLQVDVANGTDQVTGTVSNSSWVAELAGDRAVFNGVKNISPNAGKYTLVLPGTNDPAFGPGGDSFGTVSVTKAGRLNLAASLADGTKTTQGVPVSKNGQWPLYASLYGGQGLLLGWITLSNAPADMTGDVTWFKPGTTKSKIYPAGFTNQQSVVGSHYSVPGGSTNTLSITNGSVVFSGPLTNQSLTNLVAFESKDRIKVLSGPPLTMSFTRSSGLVRGTVENGAGATPFNGVSLQNQNVARGYFIQNTSSGALLLQSF
jgi:uncharacterized repeat protein (TIGR03803 family)